MTTITPSEFTSQFTVAASEMFLDHREPKPEAKARIWCDHCLKDIRAAKFSPEAALRAMERLIRGDRRFLSYGDLVQEIESERIMEVG